MALPVRDQASCTPVVGFAAARSSPEAAGGSARVDSWAGRRRRRETKEMTTKAAVRRAGCSDWQGQGASVVRAMDCLGFGVWVSRWRRFSVLGLFCRWLVAAREDLKLRRVRVGVSVMRARSQKPWSWPAASLRSLLARPSLFFLQEGKQAAGGRAEVTVHLSRSLGAGQGLVRAAEQSAHHWTARSTLRYLYLSDPHEPGRPRLSPSAFTWCSARPTPWDV